MLAVAMKMSFIQFIEFYVILRRLNSHKVSVVASSIASSSVHLLLVDVRSIHTAAATI